MKYQEYVRQLDQYNQQMAAMGLPLQPVQAPVAFDPTAGAAAAVAPTGPRSWGAAQGPDPMGASKRQRY